MADLPIITVGSLFSGIGGFDLGFERVGMQTVWQCESDPFCQLVLSKHWPDVYRYSDVRFVSGDAPHPTVLCGGFPCQDLSTAKFSSGKGTEGLDGSRSGLWSEFARLIRELRPEYVVIENSPQLANKGLDRVLCDLAESGYDAEWNCIRAHDLGAPHLRERLYLIAYTHQVRQERQRGKDKLLGAKEWAARESKTVGSNWWTEQPEPPRVAYGFPGPLDKDHTYRVAATGNALLPQIAEWIGKQIMDDIASRRCSIPA